MRGKRAVDWRLVDEVVAPSVWQETVAARAGELAMRSGRPEGATGITLTPLQRMLGDNAMTYPHVHVALDRAARRATITVHGPHRCRRIWLVFMPPARRSGRWRWRASWMMRCCICG